MCVQMDFMRKFEANAKCNNINHFWSQYFKFLVVLKCHIDLNKKVSELALHTRGKVAPPPLCVQMDFTWTFEANTKCNNMKYVWSHFFQILVVLKYHRRLWNNIYDTDIFTYINTHIKGAYLAFFEIFMLLEMSVPKLLFHRRLWYIRTTKVW